MCCVVVGCVLLACLGLMWLLCVLYFVCDCVVLLSVCVCLVFVSDGCVVFICFVMS